LQTQLIDKLDEICAVKNKQVLLATHSTEILRHAEHDRILAFKAGKAKYLAQHIQKMDLFIGLGSEYAPKLDPLKKSGRLLIVENLSDERLLRAWAQRLGVEWPKGLVAWPWNGGSKERKQLYLQLKAEIPELKAISLRDRDDLALDQVDDVSLADKSTNSPDADLLLRVWRRRHIENYLLCPAAITRTSGWPEEQVVELMAEHALVVPPNFAARDVAFAMLDARGKEILHEHPRSVKIVTGATPLDIAKAMLPEEIPEDVRELIGQIQVACA
jgi:hypothetical protein